MGERMRLIDQGFKPLFENMRIDLRGRDIGVAEHLLHGPQIRAMGEKVAREGVA